MTVADRVTEHARVDAQADEVDRVQPGQHLCGRRARHDVAQQVVVGDEERRLERLEAQHPECVEDASAAPAELEVPGLDAADDDLLVVIRVAAVFIPRFDDDRPRGQLADPLGEPGHLRGAGRIRQTPRSPAAA